MLSGRLPLSPSLRDDLAELYRVLRPRSVACLGVRTVLDFPLDAFLIGGSQVWLVEETPGLTRLGFRDDLVHLGEHGFECVVAASPGTSELVCRSFVPGPSPTGGTCGHFALLEGSPPRCRNFVAGPEPRHLVADLSRGTAACFTSRVEELIVKARAPDDLLRAALVECSGCADLGACVEIPDASVDLAISILTISRTAAEAYGHFVAAMSRRFGVTWKHERTTVKLISELEASLLEIVAKNHLREALRLLKPDGRLFLATPIMEASADAWGTHAGATTSLSFLARSFVRDDAAYPLERSLQRIVVPGGGDQLAYCCLSAPRLEPVSKDRSTYPRGQLRRPPV